MSPIRARRHSATWAVIILALCSIPSPALPPTPDILGLDKFIHFSMFALLGWLLMHAVAGPLPRRAAWTLGLGLTYAVATEIYQGLLPFGREMDPYDALANAVGLTAALALALVYLGKTATPATTRLP